MSNNTTTSNSPSLSNNFKTITFSIVMAYYNRKQQLLCTLDTILKSKYINTTENTSIIEIIIVDDNSDESERLEDVVGLQKYDKLNIRLIRLNEKKFINPCYAYNLGLKETRNDIVIIQNPEVCHIGDILSYTAQRLQPNDYLSFSCYGSANIEENTRIINFITNNRENDIHDYIQSKTYKIGGNSLFSDNIGGWLNHRTHFVGYHYLIAVHRNDLINKLNGGFDPDYSNGLCHDDDDFVRRVEKAKFNVLLPNIDNRNNPMCIHLWHTKPKQLSIVFKDKWTINSIIFKQKMAAIKQSSSFPYFLKPNIID